MGSQEAAFDKALREAKGGGKKDASGRDRGQQTFSLRRATIMALKPDWMTRIRNEASGVQKFDLEGNALDALPSSLADLPRLKAISLKSNEFKVFPEVLLQITRLTELILSENQLKVLPDGISSLRHLKVLELSDNNELTALPNGFCDLTALTRLKAENCGLESLPEDFGELSALQELDISHNSFVRLPESMGALTSLITCDLSINHLQRIPPSMGYIQSLRELKIDQNDLPETYRAAAVGQGISGLLSFLRKEDERERQEEIERMKPVGKEVGAYMEYKLRINENRRQKQGRFMSRRERAALADAYNAFGASDNRCPVRTGACAVVTDKYLAMLGGIEVKSGNKTNSLYLLNLETLAFHLVMTRGDAPLPRDGHCLIYDEAHNQLVMFGGRDAKGKRLNDVWTIDLEMFLWQKRMTEGPVPGVRENASAAYMPETDCMVIFGGKGSPKPYNDLFMLDLNTFTWFKPGATGTKPPPRQSAAIAVSGQHIFVHGGRSNFVQDDLFAYNTKTGDWINIETMGRPGAQRHKHIMHATKGQLYIFGGLDDMGGLCSQMHRMAIPEDLSAEHLMRHPPEYFELDTGLEAKRHRISVFSSDHLHCLQVGGFDEEEPPDSEGPWYDCFKYIPIESLKDKEIGSDTSDENPKRGRVDHTRLALKSTLPASYTTNTPKEERVIEYAKAFQRTFGELYPHRRPLFLTPPNEAGVPKLVCTTLRPTEMPYPKLYNYDTAAHFISEFIKYEPLENPVKFPSCLPSPMTVISWQAGDSFDMSTLLCSFLLGVGYNAYVVAGYAPRDVTLNRQVNNVCPILKRDMLEEKPSRSDAETEQLAQQQDEGEGEGEGDGMEDVGMEEVIGIEPVTAKYVIKETPPLTSQYQAALQQEERDRRAAEATEASAAWKVEEAAAKKKEEELQRMQMAFEYGQEEATEEEADPHAGRRVHAWVLLLPKKRGVTDPIFIEPTTGECFSPEDCPYEGVESVWNHQNFWVCMQMPEPHSDSRAHPRNIKWDLTNPQNWEFLLSPAEDILAEPEMYPGAQDFSRKATAILTGEDPIGGGTALPIAGLDGASSVAGMGLGIPGIGGELKPPKGKGEDWADSLLHGGPVKDKTGCVVEVPGSWVPRLVVTRDAYDTRCPRGHKVVMYHKCKYEIFAYFGECAKAYEGRVERLTLFADVSCTLKTETWEFFQRRADKLRERRVKVAEEADGRKVEKLEEHFEEGSSYALKMHSSVRGMYRETHYWTEARLDGLVSRKEWFEDTEYSYVKWVTPQAFIPRKKIVEVFQGRDDRLVYRSVRYAHMSPDDIKARRNKDAERTQLQDYMRTEQNQPIIKITEKFERDPQVPAGQDVAKRRFHVKDDIIEVHYHYGEGKVTRASKVFNHGDGEVVQVDPMAPPVTKGQLAEEYLELAQQEREAVTAVRDVETEIREMMTRREEEDSGGVNVPYYDVIRENQEESDGEVEEEEATEYDYLAPYLPEDYHPRKPLTVDQAREVRQAALNALKKRLLRREAIIRNRLEEENAALMKKQAVFARDRESFQPHEEEAHEREVEEALFKLQILDQRKRRHDEEALLKFYELDQKIKKDPRLAPLLH